MNFVSYFYIILFRPAAAMSQEIDAYLFSLENFREHNVINMSNWEEKSKLFFLNY